MKLHIWIIGEERPYVRNAWCDDKEMLTTQVNQIATKGLWFGDTFFPPHRIMKIEIEKEEA